MSTTSNIQNNTGSGYVSGKASSTSGQDWNNSDSGGFMDVLTVAVDEQTSSGISDSQTEKYTADRDQQSRVDSADNKPEKTDNDENVSNEAVENESANESESTDGAEEKQSSDNDSEKTSSKENDNTSDKEDQQAQVESQDSSSAQLQALASDVKQPLNIEVVVSSETDTETQVDQDVILEDFDGQVDSLKQDKANESGSEDKGQQATGEDMTSALDKLVGEDSSGQDSTGEDLGDLDSEGMKITDTDGQMEDSEEGELKLTDQQKTEKANAEVKSEQKTDGQDKVAVKVETKEDLGSDVKKNDYKVSSQDYSAAASASDTKQDSSSSDANSRRQGQQKAFDYTENISSFSASTGTGQSNNVNDTLALDKTSENIEVDAARSVDSVVKSVRTMVQNGNSTMVVRLDPPELGQLNIKISSGSDGMSIEIQATNAKAQQMLQQNSSQLKSALENSGVNVNNVDVQFKPEMKNNANAGSDSRDSQPDFAGQEGNQNFSGQSDEAYDDSYKENLSTWSQTGGFEENLFETDNNESVAASMTSDSWQELSFDTVDVTV